MTSPIQLAVVVGLLIVLEVGVDAARHVLSELTSPSGSWGLAVLGALAALSCVLPVIAFERFTPRTVAGRIAGVILWLLTAAFVVGTLMVFFGPGGHPPAGVLLWGLAAFAGGLLVPMAVIAVVVASGRSESHQCLAIALVWLTILDVSGIGSEAWRWLLTIGKLVF